MSNEGKPPICENTPKSEKYARTYTLWRITLEDYCNNTSLACFRYIVETQRPLYERICWAIAIVVSIVACYPPIIDVWHKWNTCPVIVTFAENSSPTFTVPFPTVTVCPSVKFRMSQLDYATLKEKPRAQLSIEEKSKVDALGLLCRGYELKHSIEEYDLYTNESAVYYMEQIAPTLTDTVECSYSPASGCEGFIDSIITDDGFCFTFNSLPDRVLYTSSTVQHNNDKSNPQKKPIWTVDEGYIDDALELREIPLRALAIGFSHALFLVIKTNKTDINYSCGRIPGIKLSLKSPAEIHEMENLHHYLPLSGLTQIALEPRVLDTSDDLLGYSSEVRHCFYPHEKQLRYFSMYTQANCRIECLTNYTLQTCHCVAFYMPRSNDTPICGMRSLDCLTNARVTFDKTNIDHLLKINVKDDFCVCLPGCITINYAAEISQSNVGVEDALRALVGDMDSPEYQNMTVNIIAIYFKDSEFVANRRSETYGFGSFVDDTLCSGHCGGLLGLSCGFSLLSLAELIYFLVVRPWSDACGPYKRRPEAEEEGDIHRGPRRRRGRNTSSSISGARQ